MTEYAGKHYCKKQATLKKHEVTVTLGAFDTEDERSLINICPPRIREAIERLLDPKTGNINWLSWADTRLERLAEKARGRQTNDKKYKMGPEDHTLRLSFWDEYYRAQRTNQKMNEKTMLTGVMMYPAYYSRLECVEFVAWLISAPRSLAMQQEETLYHGLRLLREVVTNRDAIYDIRVDEKQWDDGTIERKKTKKLNTRAVAEVRRIVEDLANRRQGSVVQRHQIAAEVNTREQSAIRAEEIKHQTALDKKASREELEKELQILEGEIAGDEEQSEPSLQEKAP